MHAQVLDFPLFVNDGGSSLKTDLGVRWLLIGAVPNGQGALYKLLEQASMTKI